MIDPTTIILFSPFDREVANPMRQRINTQKQFENFITQNNGTCDCFTSVYPHDFTIDKLFFDFDGPQAIPEAKRVFEYVMKKLKAPIIPIISGKKGIHLYIFTQPLKIDDPRPLIKNAQLYILLQAFESEIQQHLKRDISNVTEEELSKAFNDTILSADRRIIGDVRRICRIPNTLRPPENKAWCTYLPMNWTKMSDLEIQLHSKQTHTYTYNFNTQPLDITILPEVKIKLTGNGDDTTGNNHIDVSGKEHPFLKSVLRPCLYNSIITKNPRHDVRTAATIELLEFLSEQQVFDIYSKLDWFDFNPDLTKYHIGECKNLKSYTCKKLKSIGIPKVCCVG